MDNDLLPGEDVSYLFLGKVVACVESTRESAYFCEDVPRFSPRESYLGTAAL